MASCTRCGQKIDGGFTLRPRLCGGCQYAVSLLKEPKARKRSLGEEDEKK